MMKVALVLIAVLSGLLVLYIIAWTGFFDDDDNSRGTR